MLQLMVGMKAARVTKELITKQNLNKDEFFNLALDISASNSTVKDIKTMCQSKPITHWHTIRVIRVNGKSSNKAINSTNKVTKIKLFLTRTKIRSVPAVVLPPTHVTSARLEKPLATYARRKDITERFVDLAKSNPVRLIRPLLLLLNDSLWMHTYMQCHPTHTCASTTDVQM